MRDKAIMGTSPDPSTTPTVPRDCARCILRQKWFELADTGVLSGLAGDNRNKMRAERKPDRRHIHLFL